MRKLFKTGTVLIVAMILVSSCDILDLVDINFTSDEQSADFVIEPASAGTHVEQAEVVVTEIKQQIEDEGASIDDLQEVTISDLTVSVVSGAENLDAFESFEITIEAEGIASKKIAWMENIPTGVTSVEPEYISDNLKDFIGEDEYTITLTGVLRADVTADVTLRVSAHYEVTL